MATKTSDTDRDTAQVVQHDPVCGMPILDEEAAPSAEFGGQRHWFCSDGCRARFLEEPQRFVAVDDPPIDLGEDISAERSDGEAGVLREEPQPYMAEDL